MLISTHLVGTDNAPCRSLQLTRLAGFTPLTVQTLSLIAGDFNTNPNASGDSAAATFRNTFAGTWGAPYGNVGSEIDDPNQGTAFYVNGSQNLDHVLGRGFTGSCTRGPDFNGTDHTYTVCNVSAPGY